MKLRLALLLLVALLTAGHASPADAELDRTIVLKIGPLELSQYALDKNYDRYVASGGAETTAPLPDRIKARFEDYLCKQVITAEALATGYGKRKEVTEIVKAMERHMLSSPEGPLYASLYKKPSISEERLHQLYARGSVVLDIAGVRLPADKAEAALVQLNQADGVALKIRAMGELSRDQDVFHYEGLTAWPFDPFPELAHLDFALSAGQVVHAQSPMELVFVVIRSVEPRSLPPFDAARAEFATFVARQDFKEFQRERRATVLARARLSLDKTALLKLGKTIETSGGTPAGIPPSSLDALGPLPLATYRVGPDSVEVTAGIWLQLFGKRYIQKVPGNWLEWRKDIEDTVMANLDAREAQERRLDETPRFSEDRRNFLNIQSLDLFERERLKPALRVSDDDLRQYFDQHRSEFLVPTAATGKLITFPSEQEAAAWLATFRAVANLPIQWPATTIPFRVTRSRPVPGLEAATDFILLSSPLDPLGPGRTPDGWNVFLRLDTTFEAPSFEQVRDKIRTKLERILLDQKERKLAREWSSHFEISDSVPYSKYKNTELPVAPWSKR